MTLAQFQALLHKLYQGDPDDPETTEDDYELRTGLLEASIREWAGEEGVQWFELWTTNGAAQAAQTTDGSTATFAAHSSFVFPGGFVVLISGTQRVYYKVVKPDVVELKRASGENVCYFTGNEDGGYTLNFITAPVTGYTVDYPFYKEPAYPDAAAEKIEMSNPMFCIRHVLSALYELDGEGDKAILELQRASTILKAMKLRNEEPAFFQENSVLDEQMDNTGEGFGN